MRSFSLISDDATMFSQTVPRRLVHKTTVAEVLLTHWETTGTDTYLLGAQWPKDHGARSPIHAWHDPMLMIETIRQAGLLLAHAAYSVPLDYHFLMTKISYRAKPGSLTLGQHPAEIRLQATCTNIKKRDGILGGAHLTAAFYRNALPMGDADVTFRCIPPTVYGRIRPLRELGDTPLPPPIDPALVGRDRPRDVVLAATDHRDGPTRWQLRADRNHPLFFDHPVDHVPGMVVIEAIRQAATHWHHPQPVLPTAISTTFHRYIEHDTPCHLHAHSPTTNAINITATQNNETAAHAHVTTMPCD
jgi:2-oxo-3-(phosphooxy)propyl 3-oxoalkanoate synthase